MNTHTCESITSHTFALVGTNHLKHEIISRYCHMPSIYINKGWITDHGLNYSYSVYRVSYDKGPPFLKEFFFLKILSILFRKNHIETWPCM